MNVLIGLFGVAAVCAWGVAVVSALRLARRLSGRRSLGAMAMSGMAWFDARNFQPDADGLVRIFKWAFAAFFACIFAVAITVALTVDKG